MASTSPDVDFESFSNIINGHPRSSSQQQHQGINPSTEERLWSIPISSAEDTEEAVQAANAAFRTWSTVSFADRQFKIKAFRHLLEKSRVQLAICLMKESGKPKGIAEMEIHASLEMIDWYIEMKEPFLPGHEDGEKKIQNIYEPLGTVVAITPWNFPLLLPISKAFPALLMGNAVIVKPSPFTPYTVMKAVEIAQQIFPPGVLQVLNGDDRLGPILVNHPGVHKISFTGSTATGKRIMADAAKTMKRVTLELGGNDASIVLPDVDVPKTAFNVALGAFFNSGQVCIAAKRAFIHQSIYEPFMQALAGVADSFKIGRPHDEGIMLGPIQNSMQYEKVRGFIEDSKKHGYKFMTAAKNLPSEKGYFIQPMVLDNPPADSYIFEQEQFGPILPCQPWSDEEDVIRRANDTVAGLGATVFGNDTDHAYRIAKRLQCGQVWINSFPKPAPQAHFGGHKQSGIGTENGTAGLLAYANIKSIYIYKAKL